MLVVERYAPSIEALERLDRVRREAGLVAVEFDARFVAHSDIPRAVTVPGTVIYSQGKATFTPSAPLVSGTRYDATITTGAQSDDGVALTLSHGWSFFSGDGVGLDQAGEGVRSQTSIALRD